MIKVTEVKIKGKKYLVTIESKNKVSEYLVSEDLLLEFRLVKDKILEETQFEKFKKYHAKDEIYQKVLHYALFKQRCTHDIIEYLERLKIEEEDYKFYLHKLYSSKILDDRSYCENYIIESFEFKLNGPRKIINELEKKRLKKELYEDLIQNIDEDRIRENIDRLLSKKVHGIKTQSIKKSIDQLKRFIVNKGYDYSTIDSLIRERMDEIEDKSNEDEALVKDIALAKKKYKTVTTQKKDKILAFLLRKGYSYHKIKAKLGDDFYE